MVMNLPVLSGIELPLLSVARANGGFVQLAYIAVLFAAIFTTAISDGFSVTEWLGASPALKRLRVPSLAVKLAVPLGAALLAHIGFSAFVDMVYPFFGYVGLFEIAAVLIYALFAKSRGSVA
jgi:uncharacterized membrane protein YkvI